RRLAGLGELPSEAQGPIPAELRTARLVVIGAGPAGLAAALAAGNALVIEKESSADDPAFQGELMLGAECVGLYTNDTSLPGNGLLAVRTGSRLLGIVAERVVVATGGASQPLPFPGCGRPGVSAARGLRGVPRPVREKLLCLGAG